MSLGDLRPREARVLFAAAGGASTAEIAAAERCSTRSVRRILARPTLRAALSESRAEALRQVLGRLDSAAVKAAQALEAALADENVYARIQASNSILGHRFRAAELVDHAERLEHLERSVVQREGLR